MLLSKKWCWNSLESILHNVPAAIMAECNWLQKYLDAVRDHRTTWLVLLVSCIIWYWNRLCEKPWEKCALTYKMRPHHIKVYNTKGVLILKRTMDLYLKVCSTNTSVAIDVMTYKRCLTTTPIWKYRANLSAKRLKSSSFYPSSYPGKPLSF